MPNTWIKLDSVKQAFRRARIVRMLPVDFINARCGRYDDFLQLLKDWNDLTILEPKIRQFIEAKYRDSKHWNITIMWVTAEQLGIHIQVEHPSFSPIEWDLKTPPIEESFEIASGPADKCVYDTDNDGNCDRCFKRGGCLNIGGPFSSKEPT